MTYDAGGKISFVFCLDQAAETIQLYLIFKQVCLLRFALKIKIRWLSTLLKMGIVKSSSN